MVLGDLDSYVQKNETRSPTNTIRKNKFKMDKRLKYKSEHHKSPRAKHWQENLRHSTQQHPHRHVPLSKGRDGKNKEMGFHQNKKLLCG